MKKVLAYACAALMCAAACNKDDTLKTGNGGTTVNNLKEGQLMLKGYPDHNNKISFHITAQKVKIEWGDGAAPEVHTPNGAGKELEHEYANKNYKTITVTAEDATVLGGQGHGAYCSFFEKGELHELHVGRIATLQALSLSDGKLTAFTLNTCTSLRWLEVRNSSLARLDMMAQPVLDTLNCSNNQLTSLSLAGFPKLAYLDCSYNQLASFDISKNTALRYLSVYGELTSLDVSKNTKLEHLCCGARGSDNPLRRLDVSKNTALTSLSVCGELTSLDVSKNTALEYLSVAGELTSLDVSKNAALRELHCSSNRLLSLNVSGATALTRVECSHNQLSTSALNSLLQGLPARCADDSAQVHIVGNPGAAACSRSIAEGKRWRVEW